jgi:hypothetical protein
MFRILFALTLLFFTACNLPQTNRSKDSQELSNDSILDLNKISQMILRNAEEYNQVLDMLNKNNLNSISLAVTLFQNAKADSLSRDSMFAGFNDFFAQIANSYLENNNILQNKTSEEVSDTAFINIKSTLSAYGMKLTTDEGEYYLEPEPGWMLKNFGDRLSSAYRDFLMISSTEQREKFTYDANIILPLDSLMARIIIWEDFIGKYPSFISINKAEDYYTQYLEAFLTGNDHSIVFDPTTKKLNENSRKAFETYIQKNPNRKSSAIVKEYYDLLKSSDFLYTNKADSFMLDKIYN